MSTRGVPKIRKKKPKLTIKNLSTALNPNNYDPVLVNSVEKNITGSIPQKKKGEIKELHFTTNIPKKEATLTQLVGGTGPTSEAAIITKPREAFDYFLERKVVWKIMEYSNNSIAYYLQNVKEARRTESNYDKKGNLYDDSDVESDIDVTGFDLDSTSDDVADTLEDSASRQNTDNEDTDLVFETFLESLETENPSPTEEQRRLMRYVEDWKGVTWNTSKECGYVSLEELYAVIGLMYYRGMMQLNNTNVDRLFGGKDNVPMFGATMTKNRFHFIKNHMTFDSALSLLDEKNRQERDKFGLMRNLFEYMNKRFCEAMVPEKFLTVEEYFYFLRTQDKLGLKYMPVDTNNTRGMVFKALNGVETHYTYRAHVYTTAPVETPTRYFHKTPEGEIKFMVQEIHKHHPLDERNLTTGRSYTSISLAEWLRNTKQMTIIGELPPFAPGFPEQLRRVSDEEIFSSTMYHAPGAAIHLCSYVVPSKCPENCCKLRNQTFITTTNPISGTSKDKKKKPAVAQIYEYTKGRHVAQKQSPPPYTCKPKCLKWTLSGFAFILDLIRMNSAILVGLNKKKKVFGSDFGYELARSLVMPLIYNRPLIGQSYVVLTKMYTVTHDKKYLYAGTFTDVPEAEQLQKFDKCGKGPKKRCFHCLESVRGPWFNERKLKVPRIMTQCQECGGPSCMNKHLITLCTTCYIPPGKEVTSSSLVVGKDGTEMAVHKLLESSQTEPAESEGSVVANGEINVQEDALFTNNTKEEKDEGEETENIRLSSVAYQQTGSLN